LIGDELALIAGLVALSEIGERRGDLNAVLLYQLTLQTVRFVGCCSTATVWRAFTYFSSEASWRRPTAL
jgi:hypothetical protein